MRCEVLATKEVKGRHYATVRLIEQPEVIGEVPMAGVVHARGAVVELDVKPRVHLGRLEFSAAVR